MYKQLNSTPHFPDIEQEILDYWEKNKIFEQSLKQRESNDRFIFYDGPPFATGLPHFGHFIPGTLKDIFPRYFAMKGNYVERRFGWDCHGLPVEYEVEKQLGISGASKIEEYGIARFNDVCRSIVLRYSEQWRDIVKRMGRWVDFGNEYRTMDCDYMESIWWVFKQLHQKDLVYQGYNILPYSPNLTSPLSNFEVNLGGYRDVHDPSITVSFAIKDEKNTCILAWTTTPWTLPSNLALAVSSELEYAKVEQDGKYYILARAAVERYYPKARVVGTFLGIELQGKQYTPIFPYFSEHEKHGAFRIWCADFVNVDDGCGVVHIAPGFGEDDFELLRNSNIPIVCPLDRECRFTEEIPEYEGMFVKDADKMIIKRLQEEGKLVKRDQILHSYPFCYRSGQPLIYKAVSSWFVRVSTMRDELVRQNETVRWVPEHLRKGRFGKWLENARDWVISRNRYWGNPIPVWSNEAGDYIEVIGSRAELEEKTGKRIDDLHKHIVDNLTWEGPKGIMRRVPEVLDCWFESGSMPYAHKHYPMENSSDFSENFPADFICEGLDQTRGWFYTLMVISTALFKKPAFKNVVVCGLMLAADGKKMSKSERNYSDPKEIIDKFGSDALRIFLMHSVVVQGEDVKYSDEQVRDVLKSTIIPLWNAYSFFVTYANIDKVTPDGNLPKTLYNTLDRWIVSEIEHLVVDMRSELDKFLVKPALDRMLDFIDMMNNWYIRRSRRRFWKSDNDADKLDAYSVLYYVLLRFCTLISPIVPFISEYIYRSLRTNSIPESVHLCDYPVEQKNLRDITLEESMAFIRTVISMGHALRRVHGIKTRQPLSSIHIVTCDEEERKLLVAMADVIREELNVKEIMFQRNEEDLVEYKAKPNYAILGKQLGAAVKQIEVCLSELSSHDVYELIEGATLHIDIDDQSVVINNSNILVTRIDKTGLKVLNEGTITVALDTKITEKLEQEGMVRDLVRFVQTMRKDSDFAVDDRIRLYIDTDTTSKQAVMNFEEYLKGEVLANDIVWKKHEQAKDFTADSNYAGGVFVEKI